MGFEHLAQDPSYAIRGAKIKESDVAGVCRNDFSKDRDRILFSRAFRRLVHKAQIYPFDEGDHFRTRLTHTIEVSQLSRSIARNLGLNEDLTEAIALGHDIGHTPFGHEGELILDEILGGKIQTSTNARMQLDYGGFKHNFYSLRVLEVIERKYKEIKGLNLTWQVLEGILKHTKIIKNGRTWPLHRFLEDDESVTRERFRMDKPFSLTLEGQTVALADEIAQRQHDLDDGLRDRDLKLDVSRLIMRLCEFADECIKNSSDTEANQRISNLKERLKAKKNEGNELYVKNAIARDVIEYFIVDVTCNSTRYLENADLNSKGRVDEEMITFSEVAGDFNKLLEEFIYNRIINSYKVNRYDGKAVHILRQLFKAYYNNPRQMPPYILERISQSIKRNNNYYEISIEGMPISRIDFMNKPHLMEEVVKLLRLEIEPEKLNSPECLGNDYIQKIREKENSLFVKCIIENNYSFLLAICDYMAGMTDNYAMKEYKALYLV